MSSAKLLPSSIPTLAPTVLYVPFGYNIRIVSVTLFFLSFVTFLLCGWNVNLDVC